MVERDIPPIVEKLKKYVLPLCSIHTRRAFDEYMEKLTYIFKFGLSPSENGFNVILRGDSHYYNFLFKNDHDNEVTHCKLIDFQFSRRGSPISVSYTHLTLPTIYSV